MMFLCCFSLETVNSLKQKIMSAHETITKRQYTHSCITQTKCQKRNSVAQNIPMKCLPHSTFTKQASVKKYINNKNVSTKYDLQSKINVHEIYRIINEIILQHEKKSKHSLCIPLIMNVQNFSLVTLPVLNLI